MVSPVQELMIDDDTRRNEMSNIFLGCCGNFQIPFSKPAGESNAQQRPGPGYQSGYIHMTEKQKMCVFNRVASHQEHWPTSSFEHHL